MLSKLSILRKVLSAHPEKIMVEQLYKYALRIFDSTGAASPSSLKIVFAYQDMVLVFDYYDSRKSFDELDSKSQNALLEFVNKTGLKDYVGNLTGGSTKLEKPSIGQIYDLAEDYRPDIIRAIWKEDSLVFNDLTITNSPLTSDLLSKVVRELGVKKVVSNSDYNVHEVENIGEYAGSNFYNPKKPLVLYHGTSSKNFPEIMRFGLMPSPERSNFKEENLFHEDYIFLTSNFIKAEFHAIKAAREDKGAEPIILELEVPDKSKLKQDYDIDILHKSEIWSTKDDDYLYGIIPERKDGPSGFEISRDLGSFSYKGRIPAKFIKSVHRLPDNYRPSTETMPIGKEPISPEEYNKMLEDGLPPVERERKSLF